MLDSFTYGNGVTHKTTLYSDSLLPKQLKDTGPAGSNLPSTVMALTYDYDNNANITSIIDGQNSAHSLTYLGYDDLDRLTSTTGGTGIGSSTLRYDGFGNITYYKNKGKTLNYTYDYAKNRLSKVTGVSGRYGSIRYDSRGNITNNGAYSLDFNVANQLTIAKGNSYLYDGHNRRVKQTDGNGTSYSMYSQNGMLLYREKGESITGNGTNYIYLGKKLIAKYGDVTPQTVNASRQHSRPFGESIEAPKDDVGYTGHKFDTDLGLSYMQARYYDPVIGRFYSNDPIGFRDVHSFNRYVYANNNPYKYVDLNGMMSSDALAIEKNNYSSCWPHCSSKEKYLSSANDSEGNAPIENGGAVYGGQDESGVHHYTVTYTPSDMAAMAAMESSYLHSQREVARGIYKAVEYGAYAFLAGEIAAASIARWSFLKANEKLACFGLIGEAASLATGVDGSAAAVMQGAKTLYPRMRVGTSVGKPKVKVNKDGQYIVD